MIVVLVILRLSLPGGKQRNAAEAIDDFGLEVVPPAEVVVPEVVAEASGPQRQDAGADGGAIVGRDGRIEVPDAQRSLDEMADDFSLNLAAASAAAQPKKKRKKAAETAGATEAAEATEATEAAGEAAAKAAEAVAEEPPKPKAGRGRGRGGGRGRGKGKPRRSQRQSPRPRGRGSCGRG